MTSLYSHTTRYFILAGFIFLFASCQKEVDPSLDSIEESNPGYAIDPEEYTLVPGFADEASGMAYSESYPGSIWVQQDGGNPNDIILLSDKGELKKRFVLKGSVNRDWEDMVMLPSTNQKAAEIFVGAVGDNKKIYSEYYLYRFNEPTAADIEVTNPKKISFHYEDGSHDADAFLVDPITKEVYLFTKEVAKSVIYSFNADDSMTALKTAVKNGQLDIEGVVSAAISTDQNEILVKTYTAIYYWHRRNAETLLQTLKRKPFSVPYTQEFQGEAICFAGKKGFFTLSERPPHIKSVNLRYYGRP